MLRMKIEIEVDKTDDGYAVAAIVIPRRGISSSCMFHGPDIEAPVRAGEEWALRELIKLAEFAENEPAIDPLSVACTLCLSPVGKPCIQQTATMHSKRGDERKIPHQSRTQLAEQQAAESTIVLRTTPPMPRSGPHVQPRIGARVKHESSPDYKTIKAVDDEMIYFVEGGTVRISSWVRGEGLGPPQ